MLLAPADALLPGGVLDGFKMAGPVTSMQTCWKQLANGLRIGDPEPSGLYLGCKHIISSQIINPATVPVPCIEYDMEEFLASCVDKYKALVPGARLRKVTTPFLPDAPPTGPKGSPEDWGATSPAVPEAASPVVSNISTPAGILQPIAARILMKLLYAARMARLYLLRAIQFLASYITKWTPECDRRLDRLVSYVWSTLKHRQ